MLALKKALSVVDPFVAALLLVVVVASQQFIMLRKRCQ